MSEAAAEGGGAPLSDGQFGEVTETPDVPPTAQSGGMYAFYPWGLAQRPHEPARRRRKRKRER